MEKAYLLILFQKTKPFPGIRVSNAFNRATTTPGEIPPCRTCNALEIYETYGGDCPLIRFKACPSGRHVPSRFRVGADFDECPDCTKGNPMELPILFDRQTKAKPAEEGTATRRGQKGAMKSRAEARLANQGVAEDGGLKESEIKAAIKVPAEGPEQDGRGVDQEQTKIANKAPNVAPAAEIFQDVKEGEHEKANGDKKGGGNGNATLRSRLPSRNPRKRKHLHPTIEEEVESYCPPSKGGIDQIPLMIESVWTGKNHEFDSPKQIRKRSRR